MPLPPYDAFRTLPPTFIEPEGFSHLVEDDDYTWEIWDDGRGSKYVKEIRFTEEFRGETRTTIEYPRVGRSLRHTPHKSMLLCALTLRTTILELSCINDRDFLIPKSEQDNEDFDIDLDGVPWR